MKRNTQCENVSNCKLFKIANTHSHVREKQTEKVIERLNVANEMTTKAATTAATTTTATTMMKMQQHSDKRYATFKAIHTKII